MLISWELLKDFVDIRHTVDEVAERLTFSGSEVEGITYCAGKMKGVVAARIDVLEQHPASAKYSVATLDTGTGRKVCVTSAHNMKQGDYVLYAGDGSVLPDGTVMGTRDFAGVLSYGMMLSAEELGLHDVDDPSGLLILPDEVTPGTDAAAIYHIGDVILDVSITPNRGDTLSHLGMAREIAGLFHDAVLKTLAWMLPLKQDKEWSESFGKISLPDDGCLCYRLGLATGATIAPSPLTARIDLAHLGMRPITNAVDVTNYVMLMLGQPLHAFDLNTLPAREITVRSARDGETMLTLDGKDRVLTSRDMLITSGGEAIALAGVMGGEQTGINPDTRTIVIESASFSAQRVSHTSRRLGINSEAAFRFSRTVDPELSKTALTAACALMRKWCGAEVDYRPLSAENGTYTPSAITLTRKKLGTYLSWDDMTEAASILEGFGIKQVSEGEFLPPSWRPDITIEEDLIEEVGRYRGYNDAPDELPGALPRRADIGENMNLAAHLRTLMMSRGFTEVVTYSFLPEDFPQKLRIEAEPLTIANPISRDQMAMRTTLLPGLLMGLKASITSGWREPARMFEQGRVFIGGTEPEHLAALLFNGTDTRSANADRAEGFFELKADVEAVIRSRGYEPSFVAGKEAFLHSGQTACIMVEGEKVGWLGRVKPALEQELDVQGVYAFELDASVLAKTKKPAFAPLSQFPASYRDVSMLVSEDRSSAEVLQDIRSVAGELLESVRLFDVYAGTGIPEGFRSLAYTLSYRAADRTLTVEEVEEVHGKVREQLGGKGYVIR
ncbi:MAG: phenylalanine--tRNA ligase subunit beta [Synergistaceae bacterium]|nr:phenylalanine--tRNA ligase subunit beta [Synergistaceae bacterium]